ncbi:MAG: sensor domain-containing diguanylate cyclase [Candidatus Velthaea sp.]
MSLVETRRASLSTLLLIAAFAAAACFLVAQLVATQRGAVRLIDANGTARMQTERIAYLVAMARAGDPEPGWVSALESSIGSLIDRRSEIQPPALLATRSDERLRNALARASGRYVAAARVLEHHPFDAAAFAAIRSERVATAAAFDELARTRAAAAAQRGAELLWAFIAGCGILLGAAGFVWFKFVVPACGRLHASIAAVTTQRAELQSLFEQTPDATGIFDLNFSLVRSNRARAELIGLPSAELVGRHCTTFVEPHLRAAVMDVFERAKHGEHVVFETRLRSAADEPIDVHMSVFPNVIGTAIAGVIAVTRDIRELRRAQAESSEMAQRLGALCAIASSHGGDWKQQIEAALALAAAQLGCEWGIVGEIDGETITILALVGQPAAIHVGLQIPLQDTLSKDILEDDDVWAVDDLLASPWQNRNARHLTAWRSMVAMRLQVNGVNYGTFAIASAAPRATPLRSADYDFLKILAALLGSIIAGGRQRAKLDSLAFLDPLTGLPNRASVTHKLDELIAFATGRDVEFAVHFIDLDRFKEINDRAGHDVGDVVLCEVARRFSQCVRGSDTVGRLGGDEFVLLQPTNTGRQGALDLAARITKVIAEPFVHNGESYRLGCSIGISLFPADARDAQALLKCADAAMYRAKTEPASAALFSTAG